MFRFLSILILLFLTSCDDDNNSTMGNSPDPVESASWVFVANEGNFGSTNGTISMIGDDGVVLTTDIIGATVQSIEVYNNKLIVLINGDSKMKIFDITSEGLSMPGIEIDLDGSGPRFMAVVNHEGIENDKIYFTNWNSEDIKVFNLYTYAIESSIPVNGKPEGIVEKDGSLWVALVNDSDWSTGTSVNQYDIATGEFVSAYDVGEGPSSFDFINDDMYISRTWYGSDWSTQHGITKISGLGNAPIIQNFGSGVPCAGSVVNVNNQIYRTLPNNADNEILGGIAALNDNLSHDLNRLIGSYEQSNVYHVEVIGNEIWFAVTDFQDSNEVKVVSFDGSELASYNVGISPRDFAKWTLSD
tara:strand:- start:566 stop:1639 length:1074 start_codon:yes stop_codon:yes gene_type:complete